MKQVFVLFAGISFLFSGCDKTDTLSTAPVCIQNEIETLKSEPVRNPAAKVWQYQYNGKTVYYIPAYCCDIPSVLLDEDCNVICQPNGGIGGGGDGKCNDFFDKRTNEVLIWADPR